VDIQVFTQGNRIKKVLKNFTAETQSKSKVNTTLTTITHRLADSLLSRFLCVDLMQAYRTPGMPAFASEVK